MDDFIFHAPFFEIRLFFRNAQNRLAESLFFAARQRLRRYAGSCSRPSENRLLTVSTALDQVASLIPLVAAARVVFRPLRKMRCCGRRVVRQGNSPRQERGNARRHFGSSVGFTIQVVGALSDT